MLDRTCCYILDQDKPEVCCQEPAGYQVWYGHDPGPDDYTESCAEHLELMLGDSCDRFEIFRIYSVE